MQIVDQIDAVLISHPDPAHIGALPYLVGRLKLNAPIYATAACYRMGELYMYDQALSWQLAADFETFSLDDVDAAFALVRQVKFQQNVKLKGEDISGILLDIIMTYSTDSLNLSKLFRSSTGCAVVTISRPAPSSSYSARECI